ncbi:SusC/RagA family TonB-linked outer membrane protein [Parachryseolinea silvisoli]|uniref:SusC/RagA family TonB-linked outer membrane protein n=1 Tax=Parachryseolinea silvisoli TaxID=2873601 RepID=UPI002265AC71|nr:SusC/RagA family TonB-linked outer membrane protein [Parachryseolinea silvisoli]MCD9015873.1 SusC/RagA family TonB-linked outer membrane protein [Parachryseolinea silvisoli]
MNRIYRLTGNVLLLLCLLASHAWAQTRTVTGIVSASDDGATIPGANVLEKGTVNGTVTDAQGKFSITVHDEATLVITFVGYATSEVAVAGQTNLTITLDPDVATLNEVVVVGYGTVKKADATGSLAVVDARAFNKGVVNSPQELLMGKVAGVAITSNSGAPGNTSTIRIRGGSSLSASNDPLIVIDGVPITNNNLGGSPNILSTINPNDIETFTVLKDASATAIYGLRASNGVILITTKRGGRAFSVSYNATATIATAPRKVDVYSADEFRSRVREHYASNPLALSLLGDANTNWQDEIYKDAAVGQDHNLTVSGTAYKVPYRVSVGYNNTDGILKTYNFERTTASLALDPSLLDGALKIAVNVKGMYNTNNFADQGAIGDAIAYDPTKPVYSPGWRGYTTWTRNGASIDLAPGNPVARLALTDNTSIVKRSIGSAKFEYSIPFVKGLRATLNLGYDYQQTSGHNNVADSTQWIYLPAVAQGRLNPYEATAKNQLLDFYVDYSKELPSLAGKLYVMGGYSWAHFYSEGADSTMTRAGEGATRVNVYETEYYLLSFFGRANYTFHDKYMVTATLRNDATSRFDKDVRWGLFPSIALGWKINQENFLKNSQTVSDLKLRLGYGVTGQQDIVGNDYPYIATYTRSDNAARYPFGTTYYNTLRPDGYNQLIKWETATTWNAGFDYGLWQNKITGSLDVYRKESTDLISYIAPAAGTNFTGSVISNVGSIVNRGVELNINADVISNDDVQWTVGYNITYNKNEVTRLTLNNDPDYFVPTGGVGATTSGTIQAHRVSHPRSAYYVYQQVYDAQGHPVEDVYVDRNGDGAVNSSDLYSYKQPDPIVYMGINSRLNIKHWDFSFMGRANLGNYVYNNVAANSTYQSLFNSQEFLANVSTQADKTRFTTGLRTRFSDFYIENASFFRMDNINLGYTWEKLYRERLKIRVGVGVQNAFVITNYSGLDPEVSGGLDNNFFPRTRSYFLNLNCQF